MPTKKSAIKTLRKDAKRRVYNLRIKRNLKEAIKIARRAIKEKSSKDAESRIKEAVKFLDKAAQKGVIKKNNAARRKSRLWQALKRTQSKDKTR